MQTIACLAAGLFLTGAAGGHAGAPPLPILAAMEVHTALQDVQAPLAFRVGPGGAILAQASGREWQARVVLEPEPGGAYHLQAVVRWLAPAEEERIALVLSWAGAPRAVNRSLRFVPVEAPLRVERGTPLLVEAGELLLSGGPGLAAARVEASSDGVQATLYLDDAAARPFSYFEHCFDRLPEVPPGLKHLAWASFDPRRPLRFAPRRAGQEDRLSAWLFPNPAGDGFVPVVVERWPRGARAAVVFTDHADRTDPAALRAVLFGSSDRGPLDATGGFLGRGLKLTRTFFVHGNGGSLDNPAVALLAREILEAGSEVALHSITPERDTREAVRAGLAAVSRFAPVTWIDHEPYTNCEAISSQGWQKDGPYGIRDLLAEAGMRWLWAAGDEGRGTPSVENLLGGRRDEARAAVAPFPFDSRLWLFRSSMFFAPPEVLAAALSEPELSALEAARGLFVAHTYLGPSLHTTRDLDHRTRLAVRPGPGGSLSIDPALDAALARLADHVRAGRLASLTWAAAGDRLRALGEVEVVYRPDGGAEILNLGDEPLPGLSLALPVSPKVDLALDGQPPPERQDDAGGARIWFDLPAGGRVVLRAYEATRPLPLLSYP
ncbi:MAG TPA: hypothetical protein VFG59_00350 [Anaeromyxobacter sp.]|nr:hypothetical protein [Anaeromyxobacter sp.]